MNNINYKIKYILPSHSTELMWLNGSLVVVIEVLYQSEKLSRDKHNFVNIMNTDMTKYKYNVILIDL